MTLNCVNEMSYSEFVERCDFVRRNNLAVKIGKIELLPEEAQEIEERGLYIVKGKSVYQMFYSENAGFYGQKIYSDPYKGGVPLVKRGRYMILDARDVNNLLGFKLVNE